MEKACPSCLLKDICAFKEMILNQRTAGTYINDEPQPLGKEDMEAFLASIEKLNKEIGCNFEEDLISTIEETRELYKKLL